MLAAMEIEGDFARDGAVCVRGAFAPDAIGFPLSETERSEFIEQARYLMARPSAS